MLFFFNNLTNLYIFIIKILFNFKCIHTFTWVTSSLYNTQSLIFFFFKSKQYTCLLLGNLKLLPFDHVHILKKLQNNKHYR